MRELIQRYLAAINLKESSKKQVRDLFQTLAGGKSDPQLESSFTKYNSIIDSDKFEEAYINFFMINFSLEELEALVAFEESNVAKKFHSLEHEMGVLFSNILQNGIKSL